MSITIQSTLFICNYHYITMVTSGEPSPLLDWTEPFECALFMLNQYSIRNPQGLPACLKNFVDVKFRRSMYLQNSLKFMRCNIKYLSLSIVTSLERELYLPTFVKCEENPTLESIAQECQDNPEYFVETVQTPCLNIRSLGLEWRFFGTCVWFSASFQFVHLRIVCTLASGLSHTLTSQRGQYEILALAGCYTRVWLGPVVPEAAGRRALNPEWTEALSSGQMFVRMWANFHWVNHYEVIVFERSK